ncbi:YtxH domain-containing protein [Archangium violaceum]|uniref:YtxH domain-containing protein n=1 Tax=Archangium violaceum TaxID=83451 RepID=UPI00193B0617|nr:YtxH domain-containing protein [Archangium violaceum]QRK07855.1 YtxH domain-containing protein [Archangium violaceum]
MISANDLKKMDKDDLLELFGLETKKGPADWLLPTLGAFSVGMLVGAGLGLLMAPKAGNELRNDLRSRLQREQDTLANGNGQRPESVSRSA